ncbi:MAG TPA: DUF3885 domain-containing protein, partial [Pseudoduganella sp.]
MNFKKIIHGIFGGVYRYALFYEFPGGLRFKLSEGNSPLDQVLSALRKATVICDDVFAAEERILVHLGKFAPTSRFGLRKMLRELEVAGIVIPKERDVWLEPVNQTDGDDEDGHWVNCAFEAPKAKLQNFLWCAFTTDFGSSVLPNPHCRIYLINSNEGVVVHPYDDRGMDVISRGTSALVRLYER